MFCRHRPTRARKRNGRRTRLDRCRSRTICLTTRSNTSVALQEAAMSELLQARLDRTPKFHREHRLGDEANAQRTIDDRHLKSKHNAERFCTEVRSAIQEVAARANSYFA